jgi:hypothetical protein
MASPELWLEVLSLTRALFDAVKSGEDIVESYRKHKQEKDTIQASGRVSATFSTYSDKEVKSSLSNLEKCRDRFIRQGGGENRARCICSVLNEPRMAMEDDFRESTIGKHVSRVGMWDNGLTWGEADLPLTNRFHEMSRY